MPLAQSRVYDVASVLTAVLLAAVSGATQALTVEAVVQHRNPETTYEPLTRQPAGSASSIIGGRRLHVQPRRNVLRFFDADIAFRLRECQAVAIGV